MSLLAHLFADTSFSDVALALVAVGLIERGLLMLPESVVGTNGWLLRLPSAES